MAAAKVVVARDRACLRAWSVFILGRCSGGHVRGTMLQLLVTSQFLIRIFLFVLLEVCHAADVHSRCVAQGSRSLWSLAFDVKKRYSRAAVLIIVDSAAPAE